MREGMFTGQGTLPPTCHCHCWRCVDGGHCVRCDWEDVAKASKKHHRLLLEWKNNPPIEANIAKDYATAMAIAQIMAVSGESPHFHSMLDGLMERVTAWIELNDRLPQEKSDV